MLQKSDLQVQHRTSGYHKHIHGDELEMVKALYFPQVLINGKSLR